LIDKNRKNNSEKQLKIRLKHIALKKHQISMICNEQITKKAN